MPKKFSREDLLERIRVLERSNAQLEETCRARQQSVDLLNAIRKAHSLCIHEADPSEIYQILLHTLVEMTGSEYGFLDEVRHDENGKCFKKNLAMSNIAWDADSEALYRQLQDRGLDFVYLENLAGLPALTEKPIFSNDPATDSRSGGLPNGHPPIKSFMGLPLFFGGQLICVAGVANREGGYSEAIADFLEPLLTTCAGITFALQKEAREKENEKRLEASEARFRALYYNSPMPCQSLDIDGFIIEVNPAWLQTLGYEEDLVIGKHFSDFLHPDWQMHFKENFSAFKQRGYVRDVEFQLKHKDGHYLHVSFESRIDWAPDGRFRRTNCVFKDVTEQKRAAKQLRQSRKSESLQRMAGAIAHHYNNLVSVIIGNLEMAMDGLPDDTNAKACVEEAGSAARSAAKLGRQMLAYLGQSYVSMESLDLSEICSRYAAALRAGLPDNIRLDEDLPDAIAVIKANREDIRQLLDILTTNSREAIGDAEGVIALRVSTFSKHAIATDNCFPVGWQPGAGAYACLEVADTGPGIEESHIEKLFDPFFSTKFTGRGLGLPVALGTVAKKSGCITAESTPGHRTVFRVFLPLPPEGSAPGQKVI